MPFAEKSPEGLGSARGQQPRQLAGFSPGLAWWERRRKGRGLRANAILARAPKQAHGHASPVTAEGIEKNMGKAANNFSRHYP